MRKKILALLFLSFSISQLQTLAASQIINDEDKNKPLQFNDMVRSVVVNSTGAQLDLTHFKERIVVNGNANQIVTGPCDSLVLVGNGNSVDIVDGTHVTKIRQGHELLQPPAALKFYELDAKSQSGIKVIEGLKPLIDTSKVHF